jgi:hypothetical protein
MSSFVRHWAGRGFLPSVIVIASISLFGTILRASAAPSEQKSPWDVAFGQCISQDYVFRGVTQSSRCSPQFFAGVVGGPTWMNTTFSPAGSPAFNVNAFGGSINPYIGVMFPVPGVNNFLVGPQVGYIGSNVTGSTFYPISGGTYATTVNQTITLEGRAELADFGTRIKPVFNNIPNGTRIFVSTGVALTKSQVTGTGTGFAATDTLNYTSFTYSAGMMFPFITNQLFAVVQTRGMVGGNQDSHVPGLVPAAFWSQGLNFGLEFRY